MQSRQNRNEKFGRFLGVALLIFSAGCVILIILYKRFFVTDGSAENTAREQRIIGGALVSSPTVWAQLSYLKP